MGNSNNNNNKNNNNNNNNNNNDNNNKKSNDNPDMREGFRDYDDKDCESNSDTDGEQEGDSDVLEGDTGTGMSAYRESFNNGCFGSYVYPPTYFNGKIPKKYRKIRKHLALEASKVKKATPLSDEVQKIFDYFKFYAKTMKRPFVKYNINDDIDYNQTGILTTVGFDVDSRTDVNTVIELYAGVFGLDRSQIDLVSLKKGSLVAGLLISNNKDHDTDLNYYRGQAIDATKQKELLNIGVFCVLFDEPTLKPGWEDSQVFRDRFVYNKLYNRIYNKDNIVWTGNLKDKRNRGKPYYCPVGWQKAAVSHDFISAKEFEKKFHGWPVAYHGTKFEFAWSMLKSGIIPSVTKKKGKACFGDGVYLTPSIIYAAHPRYATPKEIPNEFKDKYKLNGEWIQVVFQCRVKPNSITRIKKETLRVDNKCEIDPNYKNSKLEWVVSDTKIQDPTNPNCKVFIVGIMIRTTDKHPYLMDESNWWKYSYEYWANDHSYSNDKSNGIKANVIYQKLED